MSARLLFFVCVHQTDFTTAFLNGNLNVEIFMQTPPILEEILEEIIHNEPENSVISQKLKMMINYLTNGNQVCRLKKALYGLKQAERQLEQMQIHVFKILERWRNANPNSLCG